jgi:uncharacterized protein
MNGTPIDRSVGNRAVTPPTGVRVDESPGRGRGVFATRPFRTSETIERAPVVPFPAEEWELFVKTRLDDYCFRWGASNEDGAVVLGYGSIYNHSFMPNARYFVRLEDEVLEFVALRDIAVGEEIVVNYNRDPQCMEPVWFHVL